MADEGMVMEVEQPVESTSGESQQTEQVTTHEEYDPFESKSARELSQWLKAQRDADPANAKFARALKDVFGQQFAFKKEFQGGLDEARLRVEGRLKGVKRGADALHDAPVIASGGHRALGPPEGGAARR